MKIPASFRRPSIATIPLLFLLASCQKEEPVNPLDENGNFAIRYDHVEFTVPAGSQAGVIDISAPFTGQQDLAAMLAERGFTAAELVEVRMTEARAVILDENNLPFDTFERVRLELHGAQENVTAAYRDPVPDGLGIIDLQMVSTDLNAALVQSNGTLHAAFDASSPISGEMRVRFTITLTVKAAH